MSLLAAMLVTAYDLGADPYMVFVLKAWIMTKQDGAWFGETVQGFVGWTVVGFSIVPVFRLLARKVPPVPAAQVRRRDALVPVLIYAGLMAFQIVAGFPVETRSIAVFAMGIPLLCALAVAGLPTDRFAFIGFLPPGQVQRQTALSGLAGLDMSLVFYESPKRIREMLMDMVRVFGGEREAAVCRELTKRFEEVRRGPLSELVIESAF